jgi:hypothetical protein
MASCTKCKEPFKEDESIYQVKVGYFDDEEDPSSFQPEEHVGYFCLFCIVQGI